ncbi:zinc finger protein 568 [Orussus abietinus]|uniref:zinc finger protein 568 n=1 Tax=Orussus abietinus TaxID=222816 RepID=UPI0006265086|nr:zinc finger protein 568 [Orussus abietinus]
MSLKKCAARTCFNMEASTPGVTFFSFPKDEILNNFKGHTIERSDILKRKNNTKDLTSSKSNVLVNVQNESTERRYNREYKYIPRIVSNSISDEEDLTISLRVDDLDIKEDGQKIHKLCRLCATLVPLDMLNCIYSSRLDIKINRLLPRMAYKNDGLPEDACESCAEKLAMCETMIQRFKEADKKLRMLLRESNIINDVKSALTTVSHGLEGESLIANECKSEPLTTINESRVVFYNTNNACNIVQKQVHSQTEKEKEMKNGVAYENYSSNDLMNNEIGTFDPLLITKENWIGLQGAHEIFTSNMTNTSSQKIERINKGTEVKRKKKSNRSIVPQFNELIVFQCLHCNEGFVDKSLMIKHCKMNHADQGSNMAKLFSVETRLVPKVIKQTKFKCSQCLIAFPSKQAHQLHLNSHLNPTGNTCEYCGRFFTRKIRFIIHKGLHFTKKSYRCHVCNDTFVFGNSYKRHMISHLRKVKSYHCNRCNEVFPTENRLKVHRKNHGKDAFLCNRCGKFLASMASLRTHLATHAEERPFLCSECGKAFKTNGLLNHHRATHIREKRFECNACEKKFHAKSLLSQHMLSHSNTKTHICDVCGARFNRSGNLNQHKKKHVIAIPVAENAYGGKVGTRLFICEICKKRFPTLHQWRIHERVHTGERPFPCPECSKTFRSDVTMKQHFASIHTEDRPYVCSYCGRRFKRLYTLTVHKKTHTGERPYPCEICSRPFAQRGDMIKHMKIHDRNHIRDTGKGKVHGVDPKRGSVEAGSSTTYDSRSVTFLPLNDVKVTDDLVIAVPTIATEEEVV